MEDIEEGEGDVKTMLTTSIGHSEAGGWNPKAGCSSLLESSHPRLDDDAAAAAAAPSAASAVEHSKRGGRSHAGVTIRRWRSEAEAQRSGATVMKGEGAGVNGRKILGVGVPKAAAHL